MPLTCQTHRATVCHPADAVLVSLPTPRSRRTGPALPLASRLRPARPSGTPQSAQNRSPSSRDAPHRRHATARSLHPGQAHPATSHAPHGDLPVGPSPRSEPGEMHATESAADMLFCPLVSAICSDRDRRADRGESRSVRAVLDGHPRQYKSCPLAPRAAEATVCRTARHSAAAPARPGRCRPSGGAWHRHRTWAGTRPLLPGPSVAVRGKPTVSPTAQPARTTSAIRPWTPRHLDAQ